MAKEGRIDKDFAKRERLEMSRWQDEVYGSFMDTSIEDTGERLLKNYLRHGGFVVKWLDGYEDM